MIEYRIIKKLVNTSYLHFSATKEMLYVVQRKSKNIFEVISNFGTWVDIITADNSIPRGYNYITSFEQAEACLRRYIAKQNSDLENVGVTKRYDSSGNEV